MFGRVSAGALTLQLGGVILALTWLVVAPPPRGFVLLIPLTVSSRVAPVAIAQNMQIMARGPMASIVVRSDGPRDDAALLRAGILPIAAPRSWCGNVA